MAKQTRGELVVVEQGFDYASLEARIAKEVLEAAERIRAKVKKTLEDLIAVGQDLLAVKESLGHGRFGPWLRAEFGWTERTAQNFMTVAEQFGPKTEMISDLSIVPTAAYLLAAPSTPPEAREEAIERAEKGEKITTVVAKELVAKVRKKGKKRRGKALPTEKLALRLTALLQKFRDQWNPKELNALADQLREFADTLRNGRGKEK